MLAIIWHSRTGASEALAAAAAEGARGTGNGAGCVLIHAEQAMPTDLLAATGYLFVCPENLATMSGAMKEMFDRCYYPLLGRIEGRPYATIIAAGSDGRGAQAQVDRIVTGWRLRRVAEPMIVNLGAQTPEAILTPKQVSTDLLEAARQLGTALSVGLAMGVF
jgi:multimeric flavodoxin WrbA